MAQMHAQAPGTVPKEMENDLAKEHERCLMMQEYFWHQRSRVRWAMFGDRNSAYFHASAQVRRRRNEIATLWLPGTGWVTDEKEIRRAFINYYKAIYKKGPRVNIYEGYPLQLLQELPKIPPISQGLLDLMPSDLEIHNALKSLGPHKAAGPDGFNAKLMQDRWDIFGPLILKEVHSFFSTGVMPSYIAKSNLVLIPKIQDPVGVNDFRPVSVCNVIYKVISKLLASRLKPYISRVVSSTQSAFVPGREISENVILLREVLHSFNMAQYKNAEFCLKVDLSKAFDRMDWNYLESILPLYGFPPRIITWVMACVRSAQFSIVLNGGGNGFFNPECGLRQGCALSPYMFIIGMDLLARSLTYLVQRGSLQGVQLAPTAPPLTNCLYADDLLIFGKATEEEAAGIVQSLDVFSSVSGQQIGPAKSFIWFSKCTGQRERELVQNALSVPQNSESPKYLGAPIKAGAGAYDFLIEMISSRLKSWKIKTLSQSGRVILIKSVLQAMPLYFMATSKIPKGVIDQINSLIRAFFWGKGDKKRYLAYVSWDKITAPIDQGGLGFRDLETMNDAMLMKLLWRLAGGSEALWAQQVRAKYYPRSDLWHSKRTYKCTVLWRNIMRLRQDLINMVKWGIGDGTQIQAFAQPWFDGALQYEPQIPADRNIRVADLVIPESGMWDVQRLISLFGYTAALTIVDQVLPPTNNGGQDRLIFKQSSTGGYSVKKAYKNLASVRLAPQQTLNLGPLSQQRELWNSVWHKGDIVPRLRIFLWKCLHNALPLGKVIRSRIGKGDPICQTCGEKEEDVSHVLFQCSFSRACWLMGTLALRTEGLPMVVAEALRWLDLQTDDEQWTELACAIWGLWRCRNDRAFTGGVPKFNQFQSYYSRIMLETEMAAMVGGATAMATQLAKQVQPQQIGTRCFVDGSWSDKWDGGIGFVIHQQDELVGYRSAKVQAVSL